MAHALALEKIPIQHNCVIYNPQQHKFICLFNDLVTMIKTDFFFIIVIDGNKKI